MRGIRSPPSTPQILVYLLVDRRAVDVVGRRRHSMVYQVGGGWERVREMVGEMVGEMVVLVVVATVERGVWRVRQSTYQRSARFRW